MSKTDDWSKHVDNLNNKHGMSTGNKSREQSRKAEKIFKKEKNKANALSSQKSKSKNEKSKNEKSKNEKGKSEKGKNEKDRNEKNTFPPNEFQMNLPEGGKCIYPDEGSLKIDNLFLLHHRYSLQYYDEEWLELERDKRVLEKPESFLKAIIMPSFMKEKKRRGNWGQSSTPRKSPHFGIDLEVASEFKLAQRTADLVKEYSVGDPICYRFNLLDKLIIGMGGESPYDPLLLMTLHPLYGLPYLPATAIKGMLLSYYEQTEKLNEEERNKLFGSKDSASELVFFDTFPNEKKDEDDFEIGFDVITPHYGDYYGGKGKVAPTDDQNTNIITFPCVSKVSFDVYIAFCDREIRKKYEDELFEGLAKAFQECGIGAKTALGYGLGE